MFIAKSRIKLISIVLMIAARPLFGEDGPRLENSADSGPLVVGDWYDVTIERHGVKQDGDGMLVKVTDDWIVLGKVVSASAAWTTGVPVLMDMPLIGRFFSKTTCKPVMGKAYIWIPRDAARIGKRQAVTNERVKAEFKDDAPVLAGECGVHFVDKGECAEDFWDFVSATDDKVVFAERTAECTVVSDPKWSGVPIIGDLMAKQQMVERKVEKRVPLTDVLFLTTQVELTPEQIKLANAPVTEQTR